jgi:hypothetical protein
MRKLSQIGQALALLNCGIVLPSLASVLRNPEIVSLRSAWADRMDPPTFPLVRAFPSFAENFPPN